MPTQEKRTRVEELAAMMAGAKAIYLADFTGIDVASDTKLRRTLREAATDYQVVKNRLAKLAAEAAGISELTEYLTGPTAVAFAKDDPLSPARILDQFVAAGGKLAIKTGYMDGRILTQEQVKALATLPSRDELLAKVAGGIQAPLFGLAAVLAGLLRNLVGVISAIGERQRGEGADVVVGGDGMIAEPSSESI